MTLTIQGANNDGSGIATLLELAEILAAEGKPPHTLVFVSTDGEEYGMLGTRRLVQTHPDTENIIAFISLDQVGKSYNTGMDIEAVGQFRKFGVLWLQLLAGEAARAAGDLWSPNVRSPFDQVIAQAVPLSALLGKFRLKMLPCTGKPTTPQTIRSSCNQRMCCSKAGASPER